MRESTDHTFETSDGTELFYRAWPAPGSSRGAILLFHRGHEHAGRMAHLVDELEMDDFDFYAWDARGHGRSPGPRGFSPSLATSVRDVEEFAAEVRRHSGHAEEDLAAIGQSVGAVLVAAWLHDYAPRIRCAVLAAPAFDIKLYVPFARPALALAHRLRGDFVVKSYVKPRFLTHDEERARAYAEDPLVTRDISVNILLQLYETAERVVADAQAITTPVQLLISGKDYVVRREPQERFFAGLGSPVKEKHVLEGFYHDTLGERDRARAVELVRPFLEKRFAEERPEVDLTDAHLAGPTKEESDRLSARLPRLSPRGLYWAAGRAAIRFGSLLSDGLRLGRETGFDSGSSLDYVYRDEASGRTPLGRWIDRRYLDAVGWKGIRRRKIHLEETIREAMERLREEGRPVHVLDVAAGHGRYVLEALDSTEIRPDSIRLRDFDPENVARGRELIAAKGLESLARFSRGDAFDGDDLAAVEPRPTLAIVSGLYELFPDNEIVSRSLAGLGEAVPAGGRLVYTGQPWHPQLEMIARTLTSHRGGEAWVMRRRTQRELDQLVERAGFRKLEQRIDRWGIFTVSLAVRRPSPDDQNEDDESGAGESGAGE